MTKFDNLVIKFEKVNQEKNNQINELNNKIDCLNKKIKELKFEIEVLHNDSESKSFQIVKMEERCNKYLEAMDKLKCERDEDRIKFEKEMKDTKKENDEYKKTIFSLKMREVETSRVVVNTETKIREYH